MKRKRTVRQSPLKLGTVTYGVSELRVAFSAAFAPYFAKVEVVHDKKEPGGSA